MYLENIYVVLSLCIFNRTTDQSKCKNVKLEEHLFYVVTGGDKEIERRLINNKFELMLL